MNSLKAAMMVRLGRMTAVFARRKGATELVVERVRIPVAGLPPALDGFRIVQMSDFHLHPFTQVDLAATAVAQANALKPDLVALSGDYVLIDAESIWELAPILEKLEARFGVAAVLGNHDVRRGSAVVRRGLESVGIRVLVNEGALLPVGEAELYVAGVDDGLQGRLDLRSALAGAPDDVPVVLLAHEPDLADWFALDGRVTLQLSGHTHGGQIRLPGLPPLVLPTCGNKYYAGLYRVGGMWVYTTRGIGVNGLPIRFYCPPEITELTLVSVNRT